MKRIEKILTMMLCLSGMILLAGCEGIDRTYEGSVKGGDPDRTKIESGLKWLKPPARIRDAATEAEMTVYLRVKDTGASGIDLKDAIRSQVIAAGYNVVRNRRDAQFVVRTDIRSISETAEKSNDAILSGALIGGGAGAIIGNNSGGSGDEGAAIGAVVGALVGNAIAKRNKDRKYALVVNVTIGERIAQGVGTQRRGNALGNETQSAVNVIDNFLYHDNTVLVTAQRLNLTLDEALPSLSTRLSRAVSAALP